MLLNFLFKLFQLWSLGIPSVGSSVSFTFPTTVFRFCFFEHFLFCVWHKMLQAHLVYLLPHFYWNQDLGTKCALILIMF